MACASPGAITPLPARTTSVGQAMRSQLLPVRPGGRLAQRLHHHVDVEARPPAAVAVLEAVRPGCGSDRRTAEVRHGRVTRRERHRPAPQRRLERREVGLDGLGLVTAVRAGVGDDQAAGQVGALGGEDQRRPPSERLADEDNRPEPQVLDGEHGVSDVRVRRDVRRAALLPPCPRASRATTRQRSVSQPAVSAHSPAWPASPCKRRTHGPSPP